MTITTYMFLVPLVPLAFGLTCAYITSHLAHVAHVPTPKLTAAEFEAAFTVWAEYRASEECYLAHKGEK
jgi:hypothetical protein